MHSALNYRQSRRSACDRCRGFKLRCERDQANGRSCERCLKAQVVCTTSVGQPAPTYLPSKGDSGTLSRDGDRVLNSERMPMPVLHRSSASKVRKPLASSGTARRQENQYSGCWRNPDSFPSLSPGNSSFVENIGLQMPSLPASAFPVEPWRDPHTSWGLATYDFPSTEDGLLDPKYGLTDQRQISQAVTMDPSPIFRNESNAETDIPLNVGTFGFTDQASNTTMDGIWNPPWETVPLPTMDDEPPIPNTTDWAPASPFGLRKRLLKLNLDLIDDLELLQSESMTMGSSCLLKGDLTPTVGKLDLPIFRMLSHSTQFIDILESGISATEDSYTLTSGLDSSNWAPSAQHDRKSPSVDVMGSTVEDGETTASSYDSGYLTMMECDQDRARASEPRRCDISTSLSMLATYCHLVRVYRAVFTELYQLFLIIPPADVAAYLLLPNLQFGQFHMDGNLTVQVQVLIELGSSMLAKIERTMGMSQGPAREPDGEISHAYILDDSPLVSIRDHIMAQEQVMCGIPLKETMNCLRQLLKEPANM